MKSRQQVPVVLEVRFGRQVLESLAALFDQLVLEPLVVPAVLAVQQLLER